MRLAVQKMKPQGELGTGHEASFVHGGRGWLQKFYHSIKGRDCGGFVWGLQVNPGNLAATLGLRERGQ